MSARIIECLLESRACGRLLPHNLSKSRPKARLTIMPDYFNPEEPVIAGIHNLPHWQQGDAWIFVTWRLADSLPQSELARWKSEKEIFLSLHPEPWDEETHITYRQRFTDEIEAWLDRGIGECFLKIPRIRDIVSATFHHFDGDRYQIDSYVIMPNHVHILFRIFPPHLLPDVMRSLKTYTARLANKELGRDGDFWQRDYHDRLIRSPKHFHWARRYIERNPRHLPPRAFSLWMG